MSLAIACAALCAMLFVTRADAEVRATLTATTDYVSRGISQSAHHAELQAAVDWQRASGWYAGAWLSGAEPYPGGLKSDELNLFAGRIWILGNRWSARAGYARYLYLHDDRVRPYDYGEASVGVACGERFALLLSYQPDGTGVSSYLGYVRHQSAEALEVSTRQSLSAEFALEAAAGRYLTRDLLGADYTAARVGLVWHRGRWQLSLMRFATGPELRQMVDQADAGGRWAGTVSIRF